MPELPEVEVVRRGLAPVVTGARILGVDVHDDRSLKRHHGTAADFEASLRGARLASAARRGKFLWLPLAGDPHDRPRAVLAHLGMSGQLLLRDVDAPADRFERIRLVLQPADGGERALVFADQRRFGSLAVDELVRTADGAAGGLGDPHPLVPRQAAHIARDPLDPAFDDAAFVAACSRISSAVKRVLLDQTRISGVGNIYADESLWAARIHPETPASCLSTRAVHRLLAAIRDVLERALAEGGTSFDAQYVNVNGQAGYFARSLTVYGREGAACLRCGTPIRRAAFMNRSSHFCPRCQRKARPSPGRGTMESGS